MTIKEIALKKYLEFSNYEGCQHIAKEHSIYRILDIIKKNSANAVLEVGLGIGTIYSAVYAYNSKIRYFGTEKNDFCLSSLKKNLNKAYDFLNVYPSFGLVPENVNVDVVVIDGKDDTLFGIKKHLNKHAVIIIEGDRRDQEISIVSLFPNCKSVHIISLKRNNSGGMFDSKHYQGGVKIIFVNPNINQNIYWLKHKILTFIKYKMRKLNG